MCFNGTGIWGGETLYIFLGRLGSSSHVTVYMFLGRLGSSSHVTLHTLYLRYLRSTRY